MKPFWSNKRAVAHEDQVIDISVAILVVALVFTLALRTLATANMTGVDPTVNTLTTVFIPIFGAIAIALSFMKRRHSR